MKLMKTLGLCAAAMALVALSSVEAAAQGAPVLTATAVGNRVTIEWTTVPGALGYTLQAGTASGLANIASVNIASTAGPRAVVDAPDGRYFLRVRAFAGAVSGPFSNEVDLTVGGPPAPPPPPPGPCPQPAAPAASANVGGGFSVAITWNQVAGATAYRVELSRSSGNTEYQQTFGANQTSMAVTIGFPGTFFARVVAGNTCGSSTSPEISFTLAAPTPGSGPRTPNPPPGQLLPPPGYGAAVAQQIAAQYRGDLFNSCREAGGNNVWLFRLLQALRQRDSRWGLNYKRGWPGDLSQDIITWNGTDGPDEGATQIFLFDTIGGHCGGNPDWNWADVTGPTWAGRGNPACAPNSYCARWTIQPYTAAGLGPDGRPQQ